MSKKVLVPIANGSEEIESVCIIDTLRRAGVQVVVAKVANTEEDKKNLNILASRQTKLQADTLLDDVVGEDFDCIALPGGLGGAQTFAASTALVDVLRKQKSSQKYYAAICASPALVFTPHGLLDGVSHATSFPAMHEKLPTSLDAESKKLRVVVDGKCITSQGPATSIDFALKIVEVLVGKEKAQEVGKGMLAI